MSLRSYHLDRAIAIALEYDERASEAPVVVAAGRAETAAKMKSIARRYGVPIAKVADVAAKLENYQVDQQIPVDLYYDVATILKNKGKFKK